MSEEQEETPTTDGKKEDEKKANESLALHWRTVVRQFALTKAQKSKTSLPMQTKHTKPKAVKCQYCSIALAETVCKSCKKKYCSACMVPECQDEYHRQIRVDRHGKKKKGKLVLKKQCISCAVQKGNMRRCWTCDKWVCTEAHLHTSDMNPVACEVCDNYDVVHVRAVEYPCDFVECVKKASVNLCCGHPTMDRTEMKRHLHRLNSNYCCQRLFCDDHLEPKWSFTFAQNMCMVCIENPPLEIQLRKELDRVLDPYLGRDILSLLWLYVRFENVLES